MWDFGNPVDDEGSAKSEAIGGRWRLFRLEEEAGISRSGCFVAITLQRLRAHFTHRRVLGGAWCRRRRREVGGIVGQVQDSNVGGNGSRRRFRRQNRLTCRPIDRPKSPGGCFRRPSLKNMVRIRIGRVFFYILI